MRYTLLQNTSSYRQPSFDIPLTLTQDSIWPSPVMLLDLENIGIAVGIQVVVMYISSDIRYSIPASSYRPSPFISHSPCGLTVLTFIPPCFST